MPTVDEGDIQTIMGSLFDANWKLDQIVEYLLGEDDEEEEEDETDSS